MAAPFAGLRQEMFELYVVAKWSSNVHNLPRMRSKDAMIALAAAVHDQAPGLFENLARAASDEIPNISNQKCVRAQWAYWARDAAERKGLATFLEKMPLGDANIFTVAAHEKHASLALIANHEGLDVALSVPITATVDRRNLAAKLSQSWERQAALSLLHELPPEAQLWLGEAPARAVSTLDDAGLAQLGHELVSQAGPAKAAGSLRVGFRLSPEQAEHAGLGLVDEVVARLPTLTRLYRFAAWHRSNDVIEAAKQLQAEKAEKRRTATPFRRKEPVRVVGGLFRGQRGTVVECDDPRGQVKVQLGRMAVMIASDDLVAAG